MSDGLAERERLARGGPSTGPIMIAWQCPPAYDSGRPIGIMAVPCLPAEPLAAGIQGLCAFARCHPRRLHGRTTVEVAAPRTGHEGGRRTMSLKDSLCAVELFCELPDDLVE